MDDRRISMGKAYPTQIGLHKLRLFWGQSLALIGAQALVVLWRSYFDLTVSKTISGGTLNRTGTMLVPIPVVTNR
jgi:hypothetical protein